MKSVLSLIILVVIGYVLFRLYKSKSLGGGFGLANIGSGDDIFSSQDETGSKLQPVTKPAGSEILPKSNPVIPNDPFPDKSPLEKLALANNIADLYLLNGKRLLPKEFWNLRMLVYSLNITPPVTLQIIVPKWLKANSYNRLADSALIKVNINDSNYRQLVGKLKKL